MLLADRHLIFLCSHSEETSTSSREQEHEQDEQRDRMIPSVPGGDL